MEVEELHLAEGAFPALLSGGGKISAARGIDGGAGGRGGVGGGHRELSVDLPTKCVKCIARWRRNLPFQTTPYYKHDELAVTGVCITNKEYQHRTPRILQG
jgi:hypothetical protein